MIGKFILFEGLTGAGKTTQSKRLVEWLKTKGIKTLWNTEPTKIQAFGEIVRALIENRDYHDGNLLDQFFDEVQQFIRSISREVMERSPMPGTRIHIERFLDTLGKVVVRKLSENIPLTEFEFQVLYVADRYCDIWRTIAPALKNGVWVVQDRYSVSTYVYGSKHEEEVSDLLVFEQAVLQNIYRWPDCTLFMNVSPDTGYERTIKTKKTDRFETSEGVERVGLLYSSAIELWEDFRKRRERHFPMTRNIDCDVEENEVFDAVLSVVTETLGESM